MLELRIVEKFRDLVNLSHADIRASQQLEPLVAWAGLEDAIQLFSTPNLSSASVIDEIPISPMEWSLKRRRTFSGLCLMR
jgi:hypothetical protein